MFETTTAQFSVKNLPESEVELSGEVSYDLIARYREKALGHIVEHLELPGFRPGKVPPEMALKKVGEQSVLEEAVELFVKDFYPALIEAKAIDAVGRPEIRITKLAAGNPVGLTIRATVYPEITLPKNYKELSTKIPLEPALAATDEEVAQTLESLQKSRQQKDQPLPELTDEFAKSIGAFESLEQLREQIKKGIGEEKAHKARDARRGKIIEALLQDTKVAVPRLFVESELEKIMAQMREDIARLPAQAGMGLKFEDYLKHSGKTEEGIRNEFKDQATKRAKLQLVLNKIATEEKLEPEAAVVEHEMSHALQHFPDANPELLKIHVETVLKNELTLRLLEGNKEPLARSNHDHQH